MECISLKTCEVVCCPLLIWSLRRLFAVIIRTTNEEITEYISDMTELSALIHGYLQVDALRRIDIDNTAGDTILLAKKALEKIELAPPFVRRMIFRVVEAHARKQDSSLNAPAVVDAARQRFELR
jgi:hypothetical protein